MSQARKQATTKRNESDTAVQPADPLPDSSPQSPADRFVITPKDKKGPKPTQKTGAKLNSRPKRDQLPKAKVIAYSRRRAVGKAAKTFNDDELAALHWFTLFPLLVAHENSLEKFGGTDRMDDVFDDGNHTVITFWQAYVRAPEQAMEVIGAFRKSLGGASLRLEKVKGKPVVVVGEERPYQDDEAIRMTLLKSINPTQKVAAEQDADVCQLMKQPNTATNMDSAGRKIRRYVKDLRFHYPNKEVKH